MDMPLISPLMKYVIIYFPIFFIVLLLGLLFFRRKFSWRLWIIVLPFPLLIFMSIISYIAMNYIGREQVKAEFEKMRQAGIPTDFKEFIPSNINSPDNAAILYEKVFRIAEPTFEKLNKLIPEKDNPYNICTWMPADREAFIKLLSSEESSRIFKLVGEGIAKPFAVYHRQYNGILTSLPEASDQRTLFRYFSLAASYYGSHGDLKKAYSILNNGFKIIKQLEKEPVLLPFLINIASMAANIDAMNTLMKQYGIDNNDAKMLLKSLETIDFKKAGIYTQEGEMNLVGGEALNILKGDFSRLGNEKVYKYFSWIMQLHPYQYSDYRRYLKYMQNEIDQVKAPYWTIEKQDDKKVDKFIKTLNNKFLAILMGMCIPINLSQKTARIQTETDATKLILALHIYKNNHGQFPDKLDALAPEILKEIPLDPFNGKAFEYMNEGRFFSLSSEWLAEKEKRKYSQKK